MKVFRQAEIYDLPQIMEIIKEAKASLKLMGIDQWQDGYPNEEAIQKDLAEQVGYVIEDQQVVVAYCALIEGIDQTYVQIEGKWSNDDPYFVMHRTCVSSKYTKRGYGKFLFSNYERLAKEKGLNLRIDTHLENHKMRKLIESWGFIQCGYIYTSAHKLRIAYDKILD